MARHVLVALTNSVEGTDAAFNAWYTDQHQHDVLKVPGFRSCQRFALSDAQISISPPAAWKYLAIYEIETTDLSASLTELAERVGTPLLPMSETLDPDLRLWTFDPVAAKVAAD